MLPGKKYKPEDVLKILRTRVWLVLVPFAVVSAVTAVVVRKLPDRYRSESLIMVMPQRVPEAYVKSTVTTRLEDRLHAMQQQILSRSRLEHIIQEFNLYPEERERGIMQDVVEEMRQDIRVDVVKGDAFRVSYTGSDRRTVQKVAEKLASLFIDENSRTRGEIAEGANQFLEAQLEDARRRLLEHENKLENYRRVHSGQLPSQVAANMQGIQSTQLQVQAVVDSIGRDKDRRLLVERQLEDAETELQLAEQASSTGSEGAATTTAQQLAQARANLQALELRFKPGHPDLKMWQRRIRDLEQKADAEALQAPVSSGAPTAAESPVLTARLRRVRDLKAELQQLERQIGLKEREEQRLRSAAAGYQARVDVAPTRESELVELNRDYETIQGLYKSLLAKSEESKVAADLERRQKGEQFEILDPARLAEKPFSPERTRLNVLGILGGLALGLGLVALLEYRDSSFKTDEELSGLLGLPVLAVVPSMQSEVERAHRLRRRIVLGVGLGSTVTACFALVAYTFIR